MEAHKSRLTLRQYECAFHIVHENKRVIFGEEALRNGDYTKFGEYMFESHFSSKNSFKNSTDELDLLVEIARTHPAILGARLTGGGFGGATINLVRREGVDSFIQYMSSQYEHKTGYRSMPMLCRIADGAR